MIVAVTGGKGGVGKSTVALNLARELEAVVVDGDVATADLPRGRGPDLHDVLADRADALEAVQRVGSVRILPSGRTFAGARAADLTALEAAVERVDDRVGRVVLDCPAGLAGDVGVLLHAADVAVVVTTPDEMALADATRSRRLAGDLETPLCRVVRNRVPDDGSSGGVSAATLERELGAPVISIAESAALREAQEDGRPLRDVDPDCAVLEPLETLATAVEQCEGRTRVRTSVR